MKCPVDDEILHVTERQGVEIDYCPRCRGVWLDRGELDKVIDRASVELAPVGREPYERHDHDDDERHRGDDRSRGDDRYEYKPKRKKRSFLSDMFEFGD